MDRLMLEARAYPYGVGPGDSLVITVGAPEKRGAAQDYFCPIRSAALKLQLDVPGVDPLQSVVLAMQATAANLLSVLVAGFCGPVSSSETSPEHSELGGQLSKPLIHLRAYFLHCDKRPIVVTIDCPVWDESSVSFRCHVVAQEIPFRAHFFGTSRVDALKSALQIAFERISSIFRESIIESSGDSDQ